MTDETEWNLVLAFPDQSPSFAHGFACGRIWEQMTAGRVVEGMVPAEVRETIEAIAMSRGWIEEITPEADGWISVKLTPQGH